MDHEVTMENRANPAVFVATISILVGRGYFGECGRQVADGNRAGDELPVVG
jgi:hypothetical protein